MVFPGTSFCISTEVKQKYIQSYKHHLSAGLFQEQF